MSRRKEVLRPMPNRVSDGHKSLLILLCGRLFLGTAQDAEALALLRSPVDWPHLCQKAAEEGMSGIVTAQLQRLAQLHNLDVPLELFSPTLHGVFLHGGTLLAFLSALSTTLRQKGLQVILLKGGALIKTVYRDQPGLRPLGDLDLLVRAEDLPGVEEVLRIHGCRPLTPSSSFFHNGSVAFDLHTDLVGAGRIRRRALAFHFDQKTLWQEALPLDPQDPTLLVLAPQHQLLHLAVHALKHSFNRLIWFIDLGLVLRQVQWAELLDYAKAVGALRALTSALFALHGLMGVQIPSETLHELSHLNWLEHWFVQQVVSRNPRPALGEVIVAFSIPGVMAKFSYLCEFSFPRREVLAEVSPSTPAWLLYPQRLVHIMARGVQEGRSIWRA